MLAEVFYWLLNMSIIATVMGLLVIAIRRIKWIPRRVSVWLWLAPFLRMMVPFGAKFRFSILSLISGQVTKTVPIDIPLGQVAMTCSNTIRMADSYQPVTFPSRSIERVFTVAAHVWIAGTVILVSWMVLTYIVAMKSTRKAKHFTENVYLSEKVSSPVVYGILRPRILLPMLYKNDDLKYVLLHEKCHIRRKDNLWRLLGVIAVCIHWFNPFAWILLREFLVDLELACDESVAAGCSMDERKEYAGVLLTCTERTPLLYSPFGGAPIRVRIERIVTYRQVTITAMICFSALIGAILLSMITNAG